MKINPPISYSSILMKFIQPILKGTESDEDYLQMAKLGVLAWNFQVTSDLKEIKEGVFKSVVEGQAELLKELAASDDELGKRVMNNLVIRKATHFAEYEVFILNVEIKTKIDGHKTLRVECFPVDKLC